MLLAFVILLCNINFIYPKNVKPTNHTRPSSKYDNPNFIRDRYYDEIWKPMVSDSWKNRFRQPFHPAWMDYCDPYHCNDYHKIACGLNRMTMRFKWFQSQCHIILNNMCSNYRGSLQYDVVDTKYCSYYVMFLRTGCPNVCPDVLEPVCCMSTVDSHVVLFKNSCEMEKANCKGGMLEEYESIDLRVCRDLLKK
ncbi:U-Kazal-Dg21.2-like [Danaus plexippus]|uniref:U-Kazal-Dg21.2-like n=1 Tax=Danaus plexippus TaxID=13037 RepID=UPI002AB1938E|nr:U-Kazal-Dg21.2-like [Danaus plexippus]